MSTTKVFIIPGWTYTKDKWSQVVARLAVAGAEPILLGVPGLTTPSDEVWTIEDYVDWLDKQLRGTKDAVVVGHSNGGRIVLNYAANHPKKLRHLILIASAGVPHNDNKTAQKRRWAKRLAKPAKLFAWIPFSRQVLYRLLGASDYYNAPPNMKKTMQHMLASDKRLDMSQVTTPVTLIWGDQDQSTPLKDGEQMKRRLPQAELHIIPGAGHSPHASHPDEVTDLIIKVLEGVA